MKNTYLRFYFFDIDLFVYSFKDLLSVERTTKTYPDGTWDCCWNIGRYELLLTVHGKPHWTSV